MCAWKVVEGAFDAEMFLKAFVEELLPQLGPFPGPNSVVVLDNVRLEELPISCLVFAVREERSCNMRKEWDERTSNTKHDKKWYTIVFRAFLKVAQIVVQSRVDLKPLMKGNEKKSSNWFNIEMVELPGIDSWVAKILGVNKNSSPKLETPIRIDIYTLRQEEGAAQASKMLLECWSISVVQSAGDSSLVDSLQAGYKKLVILLRSIYNQSRQLPLWRARCRAKGTLELKFEISAVENVTHCDTEMAEFQFGTQHTPFGRLYVSVRYCSNADSQTLLGSGREASDRTALTEMVDSEYFNQPLTRQVTAPIPIVGSAPRANQPRERAFSAPIQAPIRDGLAPGFQLGEAQDSDMCDSSSSMTVQCFHESGDCQPHSLPPRLPSGWGPAGRVHAVQSLNRIVAPALSDGVAQPVDIPMGKLRKVNSRSSMEDVLGSSRTSHSGDTGPSSFGSSFGSSPYNMFGFTPPFASAGATPPFVVGGPPPAICEPSPPASADSAYPLVFGKAKNTTSRIVPISAFTIFNDDAEASGLAEEGETSANAYSVFIEQQQQEFCSEQLPFADPAGSEDHDSKIGSFVEECWHAPALRLFSDQNGKRAQQSTKSLEEELIKLRGTKEMIQRESPD